MHQGGRTSNAFRSPKATNTRLQGCQSPTAASRSTHPTSSSSYACISILKPANCDVQGLHSKGYNFLTIWFSSQNSLLGTYQAAPLLAGALTNPANVISVLANFKAGLSLQWACSCRGRTLPAVRRGSKPTELLKKWIARINFRKPTVTSLATLENQMLFVAAWNRWQMLKDFQDPRNTNLGC